MYEFLMIVKNLSLFIMGIFAGVLTAVIMFHRMEKLSKILFYILISICVIVSVMLSINIILP